MDTLFADSPDGTRIAYDLQGSGPAVMLLHGGGGRRQDWHEAGYVGRLRDKFTAIAVDLRGHGESDRPTEPVAYTPAKMGDDFLTVATACGVQDFSLWGMSFGGKIGRYLAVSSRRVTSLIMMGTPLGPGVSGERRQQALDFCTHWAPIVHDHRAGILNLDALTPQDRDFMARLDSAVVLAWVSAMLEWPAVEPADFLSPTLWLIGAKDSYALASYHQYAPAFGHSCLEAQIVAGLDHDQLFSEIDLVLPDMMTFTLRLQPDGE